MSAFLGFQKGMQLIIEKISYFYSTHKNYMLRTTITTLLFCLAAPFIIYAQNSDNPKEITHKLVFKGATIFVKPGQVLDQGQILIEDGIIKAVGRSIEIPYDAKVIDVDSMYIYPAFISGATHSGWKSIETSNDRVADPGNPPADRAGLTPQRTIRSSFENKFSGLRTQGFGFAQVVPSGRFIPGQGTVVSTGNGDFNELYIMENNVLFCTLSSAAGVFPNTIMGVMSYYRDLFRNVKNYAKYQTDYTANPTGLNRPAISEEMKALEPYVIDGKTVIFEVEDAKDFYRAHKLVEELDMQVILTGIKQGSAIIEDLKPYSGKLLLSLDLPKKADEKKKDKKKLSADEQMLAKKKEAAIAAYVGQSAALKKAGVTFGYSTLEVKEGDIKKNLLRILETDITAEELLQALTVNTAEIIGVDHIAGTLEKGKIGNLFISDTLYFTEKSKIKFTYIDGELKEEKGKKSSGEDNLEHISGTWKYTIDIPGMVRAGRLKIEKSGESYDVKVSDENAPASFTDVQNLEVDDKTLTFSLQVTEGGTSMNVTFDITFDEETLEGNVTAGDFGTFPVSGSKVSPE